MTAQPNPSLGERPSLRTAEVNAAVAGAFDGGATEVRVLDGHGRNQNKGFITELLDKRVKKQWIIPNSNPVKWEGVDASVGGLAVIGQHAMAGTVNGFLDHTMNPRQICRFTINGVEHGEPGYFALYSGYYNIPFIYGSGDEAWSRAGRSCLVRIRSVGPCARSRA